METPSPEIRQHIEVPARQCFPARETMIQQFNAHVESGQIDLIPGETSETNVHPYTWNFVTRNPGLDFSQLVTNQSYTYEEVLDALPEGQRKAFEKAEADNLNQACFQSGLAGAQAWWVSENPTQDRYPWLDTATLHAMFRVEIGNHSFMINDFSGKVDIDKIVNGLKDIATMLEAKGVNIGSLLNVLNIQPEDHPDFVVPEKVKEELPTAFVAANVNKARRVMNFNERSFLERDFREQHKDGEFVAVAGWGPAFVHELGHFLNMGFSDLDDNSYALEIGWAVRRHAAVDDYGEQHILAPLDFPHGSGDFITDDFGNQVFIAASKHAKILVDGYKDKNGKTVAPPSKYAGSDDAEDIAESFAAYVFVPEKLDTKRTAMAERLIDSVREDQEPQEVILTPISLKDFDPWEEILPKKIKYHTRIYNGPKKRSSAVA